MWWPDYVFKPCRDEVRIACDSLKQLGRFFGLSTAKQSCRLVTIELHAARLTRQQLRACVVYRRHLPTPSPSRHAYDAALGAEVQSK